MTDLTILMNYLIKKNPDATIKDWIKVLKEIEEDRLVVNYVEVKNKAA